MTGYRERLDGDEEDEGKTVVTVVTRSRHASCEEELSSFGLASPQQDSVPQTTSGRRLSLPTIQLDTSESIAVTNPENYQQTSSAPPDPTVLETCRAPWPRAWPPACPHRLHISVGGPPCYLCSVLDEPPKYRKHEARGWKKLKKVLFSPGSQPLPESAAPRGQDRFASVYTISEWPLRSVPRPPPAHEAQASSSVVPEYWASQERDNPGFDIQETEESDRSQEDGSRTTSQLPASVAHSAAEGDSSSPIPLIHHPPSTEVTMSPPPYSQTPPAITHFQPHFLPEDSIDTSQRITCNKHLVCQLLYSFILALATSTLVVSFDEPVIIVVSVIIFLAMFIFLPVIALIECLFRMKMERNFRQDIIGFINSSEQPSYINPIVA